MLFCAYVAPTGRINVYCIPNNREYPHHIPQALYYTDLIGAFKGVELEFAEGYYDLPLPSSQSPQKQIPEEQSGKTIQEALINLARSYNELLKRVATTSYQARASQSGHWGSNNHRGTEDKKDTNRPSNAPGRWVRKA